MPEQTDGIQAAGQGGIYAPPSSALSLSKGSSTAALNAVAAKLHYFKPSGQQPEEFVVIKGARQTHEKLVPHRVSIFDARPASPQLSLDEQGFALVRHRHPLSDFSDERLIRAIYYPFAEQIVRDVTGASKVIACQHNLRMSQPDIVPGNGLSDVDDDIMQSPVWQVHADCTIKSGPVAARQALEYAGAPPEILKGRFSIINVWQPFRGAVLRDPLALCDARTVSDADLIPTKLVKDGTYRGLIYSTTFNPQHRWSYFPQIGIDEALLFKCFDSASDGRARFVPHAAFENPLTPSTAPPRTSIEVRTLAIFAPMPMRYTVCA